jgi:hypothetical protein
VSCEYDYIVTNPNHPEEYIGIWNRDSTYVNGKKVKEPPMGAYFNIYQESVEINHVSYYAWKVDKTTTPPTFVCLDDKQKPIKVYEIVKSPTYLMELRYDSAVYYLYKVR